MNSHFCKTALLTIFFLLAGCNGSSDPSSGAVSGKVSLSGEAITEGTVSFFSSALATGGMAQITAAGTYTLPGKLPAGEYTVTVNGPESTPDDPALKPTKIPKKYWLATTSGLTFTVTGGNNEFDIELTN